MRGIKKLCNVYPDLARPGRVKHCSASIFEIDSEYKNRNIGFHPKSLRSFLRILCVLTIMHYEGMHYELSCAPRGILRHPRFASLAITRIYALVQLLLTNNRVKQDFNSMLNKIDSVKEISYTYICK